MLPSLFWSRLQTALHNMVQSRGNGAPQALYCPFPSQPPVFGASGVLSCLASVLCHGDEPYEEVEFCLLKLSYSKKMITLKKWLQ